MTTLVTGGSGFIGRNLIKTLLNQGHDVLAFNRNHLGFFDGKKNIRSIQGDLVTGEGLEKIPWQNLDSVIHLAAAGVKSSLRNWDECVQVNILGTERLLNSIKIRATKNPKVFLPRSFYEKTLHQIPAFRNNPYIVTKETSSKLATFWSNDFQGAIIFGTLFHTFGPDDHSSSLLSYAARKLKDKNVATFSSGKALGDWLFIDDTISGIMAAIESSSHGVSEWDIGSGNLTSIYHLVEQLRLIAGRDSESVIFDPKLDRTDIVFSEAAKKIPPHFSPSLSLQEGLEKHYNLI